MSLIKKKGPIPPLMSRTEVSLIEPTYYISRQKWPLLKIKKPMTFSIALDSDNSIHYLDDFLTDQDQELLNALILNNKLYQPTLKIFGHSPKFFDTTFATASNTAPSRAYNQAIINEPISAFSSVLKAKYDSYHPNEATNHFNCNLVYYSPLLANGGSRGKHQDNPNIPLKLVLIYSYGQDRDFAIFKNNRKVHQVTLKHNSLIAMSGRSFQKIYHHQLKPLKRTTFAKDRWSFNTRFI